ncbi:M23 family metallopeptidase [Pseudonocardia spirodelae]|uniref:M23 family metallopeptidase n=1 Tax=Pseudonocardia spirodelae TaxID=3133431 RepID=A0ABU8T5E9_9PSEU
MSSRSCDASAESSRPADPVHPAGTAGSVAPGAPPHPAVPPPGGSATAGSRTASLAGARPRAVLRVLVGLAAVVVTVLALGPPGPAAAAEPAPPAGPAPPARPPGAGIPAPGADYSWPLLPAPAVTALFRKPAFRFGRGHRGADLAGTPGQAVLVAREGVVVFAGRIAGRGVVSVDHPDGLRSTYEPVTAGVAAGDRLAGGDPVGALEPGHPGCPVAACLHWGVRRERLDHLDPLVLLRPPRVRLLPWDGAPDPPDPVVLSLPAPVPATPAAG